MDMNTDIAQDLLYGIRTDLCAADLERTLDFQITLLY